jgi:hypothetical protein
MPNWNKLSCPIYPDIFKGSEYTKEIHVKNIGPQLRFEFRTSDVVKLSQPARLNDIWTEVKLIFLFTDKSLGIFVSEKCS